MDQVSVFIHDIEVSRELGRTTHLSKYRAAKSALSILKDVSSPHALANLCTCAPPENISTNSEDAKEVVASKRVTDETVEGFARNASAVDIVFGEKALVGASSAEDGDAETDIKDMMEINKQL